MTAAVIAILVVIVLWVALAAVVANYATTYGFRFMPVCIAGVFLGFPIVLLAVAIGGPIRDAVILIDDDDTR